VTQLPRPTVLRAAALTAAALLAFVACGSSGSSASKPDPKTSTSSSTSTSTSGPATRTRSGLRGDRYCEVLLLHPAPAGITADVYNTYPINDCPAAQWQSLDAAAIARENTMLVALLNGPRYWLMDTIDQSDTGNQPHKTFGGMEMIRRATVVVGNPIAASKPYTVNSVDRQTVFSFDTGRTVYEITDATGTKFVMQSWSQQVDPTLAQADLATLGTRLHLPAGWSYAARRLTAPLRVVTTGTTAKVFMDELKNSYSMETS
jgi:hypothetical protein